MRIVIESPSRRVAGWVVALALLSFACRTTQPADAFTALESRMLNMDAIDVSFDLKSTGAVESASKGTLRANGRDVIVDAETTFIGTTRRSHALTDHDAQVSQKQLLVLGWARLGLLHNMVMLSQGKPIMHNVERSVRVKNVRWNRADRSFTLDIEIDGTEVARGQLWLGADGRPLRRTQTVYFPAGDMHVEERYEWR